METSYECSSIEEESNNINTEEALDILRINSNFSLSQAKERADKLKESVSNRTDLTENDKYICIYNIDKALESFNEFKSLQDTKKSETFDEFNQLNKKELYNMILIDSRHRKDISDTTSNFILDLTHSLKEILFFQLVSVTIPATWNVISRKKGNNCMIVKTEDAINDVSCNLCASGNDLSVLDVSFSCCSCIDDGTYTVESFIDELNKTYGNCLTFEVQSTNNTNKFLKISNNTDYNLRLVFFQPQGFICNNTENKTYTTYKNYNLGFHMGFKKKEQLLVDNETNEVYIELKKKGESNDSIVAGSPIDIGGPLYIVIAIDDFNKNHMNSGLITADSLKEKTKLPEYYKQVVSESSKGGVYDAVNNEYSNYVCYANDKSTKNPFISKNPNKSVANQLTTKQIDTVNAIIETNNEKNYNVPPPAINDSFAVIPAQHILNGYIRILGTSLKKNARSYLRPVTINRLHIKLYDDRGFLLDINENDWYCTVEVKHLYKK